MIGGAVAVSAAPASPVTGGKPRLQCEVDFLVEPVADPSGSRSSERMPGSSMRRAPVSASVVSGDATRNGGSFPSGLDRLFRGPLARTVRHADEAFCHGRSVERPVEGQALVTGRHGNGPESPRPW